MLGGEQPRAMREAPANLELGVVAAEHRADAVHRLPVGRKHQTGFAGDDVGRAAGIADEDDQTRARQGLTGRGLVLSLRDFRKSTQGSRLVVGRFGGGDAVEDQREGR
jgi:hypothetical protein